MAAHNKIHENLPSSFLYRRSQSLWNGPNLIKISTFVLFFYSFLDFDDPIIKKLDGKLLWKFLPVPIQPVSSLCKWNIGDHGFRLAGKKLFCQKYVKICPFWRIWSWFGVKNEIFSKILIRPENYWKRWVFPQYSCKL